MHVLLWPGMQSSLFDPRVYHQGIPALVEEMLCALTGTGSGMVSYHGNTDNDDAARHG